MPVNPDLHYLLSGLHLDENGIQVAEKRADLSPAVNVALQAYAEEHLSFSTAEPKHGFCNEPTYRLNHAEATICQWRECFTDQQINDIEAFCEQHHLPLTP